MAQLKVKRLTLTGESTPFTFDVIGVKFLVKNLSDEACLVSFNEITDENAAQAILIPSKVAQLVLTNEFLPANAKTIYVKGTGLVEVQIIKY